MDELFRAVRRIENAHDPIQLKTDIEGLSAAAGFEFMRTQVLSRACEQPSVSDGLVLHTYDDGIESAYFGDGWHAADPTLEATRRATRPYEFSEIGALLGTSMEHNRVIDGLRSKGISHGLFVPAYGPNGLSVHVGLTSTKPVEISRDFKSLAQYAVQTLVLRAEELGLFACRLAKRKKAAVKAPELSRREREVLFWIVRGKSNTVIGDILGISEHTVGTLVKRCFGKLGVSSRVSAAVRGVDLNLVEAP